MSRGRPDLAAHGGAVSVALALTMALGLASAPSAAPPAAGGVGLLAELDAGSELVVGRVGEPRSLDRHGRAADLRIEASVSGRAEPGSVVTIVWEELATARPARFGDGDRVLVGLEPVPGASLWRARLPDPALRARARVVTQRGNAFLRDPSTPTLEALRRLATLDDRSRAGAAGAEGLAALAARAEPPLALEAVVRLRDRDELAESLSPQAATLLGVALLRRDTGDAMAIALVELIERHRPEVLRPELTRLATRPPPRPAGAIAALAALDGGIALEPAIRLAQSDSPVERSVAARWARGPGAEELVGRLARRDADPAVRRIAVQRLAREPGPAAEAALLHALGDPAPAVRRTAIEALGAQGERAVPSLVEIALAGREDGARSAVAALDAAGPAGQRGLVEVAERHEDAGMRLLAEMALGLPVGDH